MSDETESGGSGQAWSRLADQFALIAQQFQQHYERVSASSRPETEQTQGSIEQLVTTVSKAIENTARTIDESVRDPKVREDSGAVGSALLRAVGATLSELGAALQREANTGKKPADGPPSGNDGESA